MKSKLNIPKKINVGFQERKDTYTGKLAYVVYTDDKGVLRKEASWNGWRNKNINPEEFENVPTEGFVLNKKVGDYKYGWHQRKAWVRVYDPRDFEFEISVQNLVFILEECSSIKGKGLEGEFVYAWDRADLVLLPVTSQEYKDSLEFEEAVKNKVTKQDMKEGYCYLTKDDKEVIYLGRLPFWSWHMKDEKWEFKSQKKHIFAYPDKDGFFVQSGFTKILSKLSDSPSHLFPEKFDEYQKSKYGTGPEKLVAHGGSGYCNFVQENDEFYYIKEKRSYYFADNKTVKAIDPVKLIPGKSVIVSLEGVELSYTKSSSLNKVTLGVMNQAGKTIDVGEYYYGY